MSKIFTIRNQYNVRNPRFKQFETGVGSVFDNMQYVIVAPEDVANPRMMPSLPKLNRQFQIRDLDGRSLGSISEPLGGKKIHSFLDDRGNNLGETRLDSKMGLATGTSVYDSMDQSCGSIRSGIRTYVNIFRWRTTTIPSLTLEDVSGHQIAISDPFVYKSSPIHYQEVFGVLRDNGLNIRAPDGRIIATFKASSSLDSIQIDILSPSVDRLALLGLVMIVIRQS